MIAPMLGILTTIVLFASGLAFALGTALAAPKHGFAVLGKLKYPSGFRPGPNSRAESRWDSGSPIFVSSECFDGSAMHAHRNFTSYVSATDAQLPCVLWQDC